jgi:tRNA(Ile)-lysidine synthase
MKRASGKKVSLPHGLHARKEYDRVIIASSETKKTCDYEYPIKIPGTVALNERHIILSLRRGTSDQIDLNAIDTTYFDEDRMREPLVVRNRRSGDWFEPLGTRGSQKIKKLFIDRKVPRPKRDRIALIADRESVIWIENMHLSERVKVSPATKNVLILEIRPWP